MAEWSVEVLSTRVLCRQPGRYIGWPTIVRRRNGELIVGFSGDRDEHVCPWGKTQIVRSQDNGVTWSAPHTVTDGPIDDRDVGIIETARGTLLIAWFTSVAFAEWADRLRKSYGDATVDGWADKIRSVTPELKARWLGNWTRRSEDGGRTWDEPVRTVGSAPHGPIQLADGRLLYVGRGKIGEQAAITAEESRDDGRTWQVIGSVPIPADESMDDLHEPHVVEAVGGRLVALIRYQPADKMQHYMRQSASDDGGRTWTMAHPTPLYGYPPHLIRLRNGWLLEAHGRRIPPYGEVIAISRDNGTTWEGGEGVEISSGPNGDLGYPASAELADGSILTIYYQIAAPGEKTSLMGTHWRLRRG
ncbi:MAG: exo-alpha-sialidase [Chloroflexi bacterium]|nr:exo-alpha-sialidase [Chloroflexota bacterium]